MSEGSPVWMLRINPLERRRLSDPVLAGLVERAAALEPATAALAAAASDDLYRLIPLAGEAMRGPLLALRRDIHNDRVPAGLASGLRAGLPLELPASVARWSDHQRQRLACNAQIRQAHAGALAQERSVLRERLGEGDFLTTLAQSASGVYDAAVRYRRRETLDSKDRKAERSLLQYLTRAMVRTSPYGRFTAVGLAEVAPAGAGVDSAGPGGVAGMAGVGAVAGVNSAGVVGVVGVNSGSVNSGGVGPVGLAGVAMDRVVPDSARPQIDVDRPIFDYLMGGLLPTGPDPWLALPPTARVSDDRVTFFQVAADGTRRLSAPLNPPTRLLVEILELGPCRRSSLAGAMVERLGLDTPGAERLLGLALRLGLVTTAWRGDEFVAQPVEAACEGGFPVGRGGACLQEFRDDLDRLSGDEQNGSVGERIAVSRRLEVLGEELSRLAHRPAKLTVNEDYIVDPMLVDPGSHRRALDDLAAVTELLCAFDRMHVVRALVAATVVERFGPGCRIPLVEHAEWLVRAVYHAERWLVEHPDAPAGPADGSLAMLLKVRQEALDALPGAGAGASAGADEVAWRCEDVTGLLASVPDRFRRDPASYGLVVQAHGCDLIVNDTYAGHGPMVSRFLHADQLRGGDGLGRLRARLQGLYGPGVRLLEDAGCHSMSINAHPRVLPEALDAQGWRTLRLVHDEDTDAVSIVDAGGAPVKVLALGAELPELFPYPVRLATWLCSSGRVVLDVMGSAHRARAGAAPPTTTVSYPRLRVGRVVLSRRRWYLGTDFPARSDSSDDIDYLLSLTRWRARHGVPAEVVLKSLFDGPTVWESLSDTESRERFFELRRHAKPQYVDLDSALMTRILPRLMERRPHGCVEEALPGLAEGGHATEWMVEMARPTGQAGFDWRPGTGNRGPT